MTTGSYKLEWKRKACEDAEGKKYLICFFSLLKNFLAFVWKYECCFGYVLLFLCYHKEIARVRMKPGHVRFCFILFLHKRAKFHTVSGKKKYICSTHKEWAFIFFATECEKFSLMASIQCTFRFFCLFIT